MSKKFTGLSEVKRMLHAGLVTLWYRDRAIRIVFEDGQLWWVVADIKLAGGVETDLAQTEESAAIPASWQRFHQVPTSVGFENVNTVSEAGLYFLLGRTTLASSPVFQAWLSKEALVMLKPYVDMGAAEHAQKAYALANAIGDRVRQDTFRAILADQTPLRFARYLATVSTHDDPVIESVPNDMRFISAESLQKSLDEQFISTKDLHRLQEACHVALKERYEWVARRLDSGGPKASEATS